MLAFSTKRELKNRFVGDSVLLGQAIFHLATTNPQLATVCVGDGDVPSPRHLPIIELLNVKLAPDPPITHRNLTVDPKPCAIDMPAPTLVLVWPVPVNVTLCQMG
jgi:hypothetical protein